ncbi:MAG: glycosyltransferase, partial [Desulfamplus sp.]|nr:glycosyltransferase [Desulfamplus sp.]
MKKKLLFITRNYPPIIGGLEKYSYDFYHNIKKNIPTELLAHSKGKKGLIYFGFRVLFHIINNGNSYSHIHLADASLSIFYPFLKLLSNASLSLTVHALDITYDNYLYQKIIPALVSRFDKIVCVSNSTLEKCKIRGIPEKICNIIPNAIDFNKLKEGCLNIEDIEIKFNLNLKGKKILFS